MTQSDRRPRALSLTRRTVLAGSALMLGAGLMPVQATAQDDPLIENHGYSSYGDLKYPADFSHLDYVNVDAPKGGEMSRTVQGSYDNLNAYATKEGTPAALATIATERLMMSTADDPNASYCYLCTTIEYPEDRSYAIFHLRDDVTFSDGAPMTAEDVVFSHNLLITQGTASFASVVGRMIPSVEALDDHTVKFTFGADFSPNDTVSQAGATPVFQKKWYDETGARLDESRLEIPPGTGPYMLKSFDIGKSITYGRNPNFWGADVPMNIGRNNFDSIRFEYFADSTAAFEAFKSGEVTFRPENSSLIWATQYNFPGIEEGYIIKEELPNGALPAATGFLFNMTKPELQDLRVRQAIALMFNFEWTNETLQYGLFSHRESFWQNADDLQATGVPEGRELELLQAAGDSLDPAVLTDTAFVLPESGNNQLDRGNLRTALALMADAGWAPGDGGLMRNADGKTFDLEFLSDDPVLDRIVIPFIENLKRLGLNATYSRVDDAQYTERTNRFDFDMISDSYTTNLEEGESLGQRFGSDGVGDIFNPASYSSPAVDALIKTVVAARTYDEMAAGVRAIDRVMRHDLFMIPTWYNASYWVAYWDVFAHPETLPPYSLGYLDFWWFDQAGYDRLKAAGQLR